MYLPLFVTKDARMITDHSPILLTAILWGIILIVFFLMILTNKITFKK